VLSAACGGEGRGPAGPSLTPSGSGTVVDVVLYEWAIEPDATIVPAGEVTFVAVNDGTMNHDLWIIKTDLDPSHLPTKGNQVVAEEAGELVARTDRFSPGETKELTLELAPGDYVLLCNVPGHYASGMVSSFSVQGVSTQPGR
jgi:uncharacterized cupredoxin-like copper-binding protein